jgi:hypothetical protein
MCLAGAPHCTDALAWCLAAVFHRDGLTVSMKLNNPYQALCHSLLLLFIQ